MILSPLYQNLCFNQPERVYAPEAKTKKPVMSSVALGIYMHWIRKLHVNFLHNCRIKGFLWGFVLICKGNIIYLFT